MKPIYPHTQEIITQYCFQNDISTGLLRKNKLISSKYFYDEKGSQLFNQITKLTDYYLTACEIEILYNAKEKLSQLLEKIPFNLVELGPGEGFKSELLIHHFLDNSLDFTYVPVDISAHYLSALKDKLNSQFKDLKCNPINADFLGGLYRLNFNPLATNLVLFLGSSIGNLTLEEAQAFLQQIKNGLNKKDYLLIGFDLRKDTSLLMHAYDNDVTRLFNLNLLERLNRELGADFDLQQFAHRASYNTQLHAMESQLISLVSQDVYFKNLQLVIHFNNNEPIHVEYSHKYGIAQIEALAQSLGFQRVYNFFDSNHYFVDSLWQVP